MQRGRASGWGPSQPHRAVFTGPTDEKKSTRSLSVRSYDRLPTGRVGAWVGVEGGCGGGVGWGGEERARWGATRAAFPTRQRVTPCRRALTKHRWRRGACVRWQAAAPSHGGRVSGKQWQRVCGASDGGASGAAGSGQVECSLARAPPPSPPPPRALCNTCTARAGTSWRGSGSAASPPPSSPAPGVRASRPLLPHCECLCARAMGMLVAAATTPPVKCSGRRPPQLRVHCCTRLCSHPLAARGTRGSAGGPPSGSWGAQARSAQNHTMAASAAEARALYRALLREGTKFPNYNVKE